MELYEIKEKVGSDPCLVLDFDAKATITEAYIAIYAQIGVFETETAAKEYIDSFSKMIENECNTRQVVFKTHIIETDVGLEALNNSVIISNNIIFATSNNVRTFALYTPVKAPNLGLKIADSSFEWSTGDEGVTVEFVTYISLT